MSGFGSTAGILLIYNYFTDWRNIIGENTTVAEIKDQVGITLGRSNYVASILLRLIPFAVYGVLRTSGKLRAFHLACTTSMLLGLAVTMSRGAMAALVLGTLISLPLMFRAGFRAKHVFLAVAGTGLIALLVPAELIETNRQLIEARLESTDESRVALMQVTWGSFLNSPVLGVGPGQLATVIFRSGVEPDPGMNAHNLVLNALGEMGVLGGIPLLALVSLILYRTWRFAWTHRTAAAVAICVALTCAILHNLVEASFEGEHFQIVFGSLRRLLPDYKPSILQSNLSRMEASALE